MDGREPGEEVVEAGIGLVRGEADFVMEVWAGGGGAKGA